MAEILKHLHLGTQNQSRNEAQLISLGITHLLGVADSLKYPSDPSLKFLHVPLSDIGDSDLDRAFQKCFDFIEDSKQSSGKTFLFCRFAQNRSPSITIAYLMSYYNKSLFEAYSDVVGKKSDISPHERYFKQLQDLDLKLHGKISMSEDDRGQSVQEMIRRIRAENLVAK
jgi:protein-tyrosine phosphatase